MAASKARDAIIGRSRMATKLEAVIGALRSLHGLALDKSPKKALHRALQNAEAAHQFYEHHNTKRD